MLGHIVHHVFCSLHLVVQTFWNILADTVIKGPDSLSGNYGSNLIPNIWEERVVTFLLIPGNVPKLLVELVKDLSRDQKLG